MCRFNARCPIALDASSDADVPRCASAGFTLPPHSRRPASARHFYDATAVSEVVPLSLRQAGQVAGLIVLGLALVIAFVRISLRKPGG